MFESTHSIYHMRKTQSPTFHKCCQVKNWLLRIDTLIIVPPSRHTKSCTPLFKPLVKETGVRGVDPRVGTKIFTPPSGMNPPIQISTTLPPPPRLQKHQRLDLPHNYCYVPAASHVPPPFNKIVSLKRDIGQTSFQWHKNPVFTFRLRWICVWIRNLEYEKFQDFRFFLYFDTQSNAQTFWFLNER